MAQFPNSIDAKNLKSIITKVGRIVARAERAVRHYEDAAPGSNDHNQASALRAIQKAETVLSALPETSIAAGFSPRLASAKSTYETLSA